jgi:uncharacterized protein (TIGR02271 family)
LTAKQRPTVVAVCHDPSRAQEAVRDLKQAGFRDDQIGVVAHHTETAGDAGTKEKGSHVAEGAVAGVAAGAGVGALWALGIAAGFLPVIGPVIAGGLLASVLASAAGGAAIAGIVGALVGLGIPEEEAHYYEGEFKSGRTIVTVKADGRSGEAWAVLHRHGAYNRQTQNAAATAAGKAEGDQTLQVRAEELYATKRSVDAGAVRVRKEVVTENKTLQVPVTHEEVVIERHPAPARATPGVGVGAGEEVRIPVKEEKVQVEKEAVVTEEVSVGKRKVADTQTVLGTVRKEQVKVEQEGDVEVRGGATDSKGKRK